LQAEYLFGCDPNAPRGRGVQTIIYCGRSLNSFNPVNKNFLVAVLPRCASCVPSPLVGIRQHSGTF
jgi:hypothetical protein